MRAHPAGALGEFTVGAGEAAHLFRRLGARTSSTSSVKRGRAGRLDAGWLPISSAVDLHAVGPLPAHSHVHGACAGSGPDFRRARARGVGGHPSQSPLEREASGRGRLRHAAVELEMLARGVAQGIPVGSLRRLMHWLFPPGLLHFVGAQDDVVHRAEQEQVVVRCNRAHVRVPNDQHRAGACPHVARLTQQHFVDGRQQCRAWR